MTHSTSRRTMFLTLMFVFVLTAAAPAQTTTPQKFEFDARNLPEKPQRVNLAGSFNGWSTSATPMADRGDGVWETELSLTDGVYYYKFVVNGDQWKNDPKSDKELEVPDGYGGVNSAVLIGLDVRKLPPPKPNHINADALLFNPRDTADANGVDSKRLRLRLRAQAEDVQSVAVVGLTPDDKIIPLTRFATERGFDVFGGLVDVSAWKHPQAGFVFLLQDGSSVGRLAPQGFQEGTDNPVSQGFPIPAPAFETPEWAKHAVWYQIFPERFRNGDPSNDPGDADFENLLPWTADWWENHPQHGEAAGQANFYTGEGNVWKRRFGGDIQGVREKLPYLRRLGVNAIYFNPVFEGDSMHKYDASDFRHIDDNFGVKGDLPVEGETDDPATWQWSESDKVFLEFIQEAHRQGFKVVIDGVFNHVGQSHPFFQDVLKNGKDSKYADWFEIIDWGTGGTPGEPGGIQWRAWDRDNGHLPVFKKDPDKGLAPGPYAHIMAITERWLAPDGDPSKGIDGWRLDVPGDIPHPFWIEWRKVVKAAKPDAYITGEIWDWAQPWLQGDQFDAVMNYRFAVAAQQFFVNEEQAISPSEFNSRLNEMIFAYPLQVALVQQNLFDSHDTDRLLSMFVNPDLPYDGANRIQDNGPNYDKSPPTDEHYTRARQAVTFQMTFLGAPMVYYGNEAGMFSPDDPSNRKPMWWPDLEPFDNPKFKFNEAFFDHHRRAIAARNQLPALRTGFFRPLVIDDDRGIYGFVRELDGERVYVIMNRAAEPATIEFDVDAADAVLIDWMNPDHAELRDPADSRADARSTLAVKSDAKPLQTRDGKATIQLPPYGTAVLSAAR